jgi:hypothetical protein
MGTIAQQLGHLHFKGADAKALAATLRTSISQSFVSQDLAVTAIDEACVLNHVVPAPPTTTTTTPPQQASGQSDGVVNVTYPSSQAALLHATYQGTSNFVIKGIDASGNEDTLFVNTIGNYDGVRLMNAQTQSTPTRLQVQASGPWTITISSAFTAPVATSPGHYANNGDQVLLVKGHPSTGHFFNTGDANFVVHAYTSSQVELLVNEIGNFSGTEIVPNGTILFEVESNGAWTVDLS